MMGLWALELSVLLYLSHTSPKASAVCLTPPSALIPTPHWPTGL